MQFLYICIKKGVKKTQKQNHLIPEDIYISVVAKDQRTSKLLKETKNNSDLLRETIIKI